MKLITLAGLNIDATVGAMESNYSALITHALIAAEQKATIAAAPEMVLCGYPSEDLVHWAGYVDQQWKYLMRFARDTKDSHTVFVVGLAVFYEDAIYNSAAVVHKGVILGIVPKEKLPTYNVFYDIRTFARGLPGMRGEVHGVPFGDLIFEFGFGKMAVEVCEDVWTPDGPMKRRAYAGATIVVNISASPWRAGVIGTRREMLATRSSDNYATVLYVNKVGGMDALVLDGGGFVFQDGRKLFEAPRFRSGLWTQVIDIDRTRNSRVANTTRRLDVEAHRASGAPMPTTIMSKGKTTENAPSFKYPIPDTKSFLIPAPGIAKSSRDEYFEELIEAMVLGFGGYFEKSRVFERALIALSGGRDSALTLVLVHLYATRKFAHLDDTERSAAMRDFIRCVSMPTRFNSEVTKSIARDLCAELGVTFDERPIEEAFGRELTELREQLDGAEPNGVAVQNIMPRIRMTRMQNLSNANKALLLHCGNMTEKAVGYGTIGGDFTAGAYSLLGNLPKSVVRALIDHLRHSTAYNLPSLQALVDSAESAELAEGQRDEDDLGPIDVLDACIHLFYSEKLMPHEMYGVVRNMWSDDELKAIFPKYTKGLLKVWVKNFVSLTYNATFKWVVAPLAAHLGSLDLDRERAIQVPVVKSMEWLKLSLAAIDALPD